MFAEGDFNGDISRWDVSSVRDMTSIFHRSKFNREISNWNVSSVENMSFMFSSSKFNGDISQWDVSNAEDMSYMFSNSKFNGDISQWNVSNVKDMSCMFAHSSFQNDISQWNISNVEYMGNMLMGCPALHSKNFGTIHFISKVEDSSWRIHPDAEAAWDAFAPMAQSMGLEGPELGRAIWATYQASLAPQVTIDDLVDMDFTMSTDWTVVCDPTANDRQVITSHDLSR